MSCRSPITTLYATISRHFSSSSISQVTKIPNPSKIPYRYKSRAIEQAQYALTEYLYATRYMPFAFAEQISKNSPIFLSHIMNKVRFSSLTFYSSLQRFLRYHPVNEFELFYESIGIEFKEINGFLPEKKFFIIEDTRAFDAACVLAGFGFPWNMLGKLYKDEISIFSKDPSELNDRLHQLKKIGFSSMSIIGFCLFFPCVLRKNSEFEAETDALIDDLKTVLINFDLVSCVEESVHAWCEVCCKIRVFYDLGVEKGKVGELMGKNKRIFLECSKEGLIQKINFFSRLAVKTEEVGTFLISNAEICCLDLESPMVSVLGFLKHFGMDPNHLSFIAQKYPYALGRNKIANLPCVMRLLDVNKWFFNEIKNGKHHLLSSYMIGSADEDLDKEYVESLGRIKSSRTSVHTFLKLDLLHGMGFGENKLTIKVLKHLHGTRSELEERFNCLLQNGIGYSNLCKMISFSPKILNQKSETLRKKMKFLYEETGSSVEHLVAFPAYLCYDLENRIKPRYEFHAWLKENGLCEKQYSLASIIATSEKSFVARISSFHPDALKKWYSSFSNKKDNS